MENNNNNNVENEPIEIVFTETLPPELQCKKCEQVLRLPQKLPCGHRFCASCIEGLQTCPECSALIDHATLKLDKESQRRIQRLSVQCTFHDNGCEWKGELRELEGHALNCEKADIICPRGCGMIYPKSEEAIHMESECSKKIQACSHCDKSITVKGMKAHLKICPEMIIDCPNSCGLLQKTRNEISEHLLECPKAGSCCPFGEFGCEYKGGRENLQKHIKDQPVKHLSYLCDGVLDLKALLATVQLNAEKLSRNMDLITTKIEALEKLYGAQMIWRIDKVHEKMDLAERRLLPVIFSPPFLTGRHGYKMIMSAHLNGEPPKNETHFALYITIMMGEFDGILAWPFTHRITISLLDQNPIADKRKHLSYVIKPYASVETLASLGRPKADHNIPFGAKKLCEIFELHKYIRDDTLYIKCQVDTENMILL